MTVIRRPNTRVAILARHRPQGTRGAIEPVRCRTVEELVVLARSGLIRAALLDHTVPGVDGDLIAAVAPWCAVVVVDDRPGAPDWASTGAVAVPVIPSTPAGWTSTLDRIAGPRPQGADQGAPGLLLAVVEAPGADAASRAQDLAAAIARSRVAAHRVVLADLTLDGPHRSRHGLTADDPGLPELLAASRFGVPPPASVRRALHLAAGGYLVVPGLRHHHDWVSLGQHSTAGAVTALRIYAQVVIAHVDADLEGESATGSFDIEDRNQMARSAAGQADLVVVCSASGPSASAGTAGRVEQLRGYGIAPDRILVVGAARPYGRRLAAVVRRALHQADPAPLPEHDPAPQPITAGSLGHWS